MCRDFRLVREMLYLCRQFRVEIEIEIEIEREYQRHLMMKIDELMQWGFIGSVDPVGHLNTCGGPHVTHLVPLE